MQAVVHTVSGGIWPSRHGRLPAHLEVEGRPAGPPGMQSGGGMGPPSMQGGPGQGFPPGGPGQGSGSNSNRPPGY